MWHIQAHKVYNKIHSLPSLLKMSGKYCTITNQKISKNKNTKSAVIIFLLLFYFYKVSYICFLIAKTC